MKFTYNSNEYELILLSVAGSRLYGTSTEKSDWDIRGIFIAPKEDKLGMFSCPEQIDSKELYSILKPLVPHLPESNDIVLYEIKKFFKLATDSNPNIMDILFADEEAIIYAHDKGRNILECRRLFLSKKAKHTFSGYAFSQLKRIKGHKKWINKYPDISKLFDFLNESYKNGNINYNWVKNVFGGDVANYLKETYPDAKCCEVYIYDKLEEKFPNWRIYKRPHVKDYIKLFSAEFKEIVDWQKNKDIYMVLEFYSTYSKQSDTMFLVYHNFAKNSGLFTSDGNFKANSTSVPEDDTIRYIIKFDMYSHKSAVNEFNQLWNWKINRNKERGEIESQIGYDGKHASHLIRLLLGGIQILKTGDFNPRLSEDSLLLVTRIRHGALSYNELIELATELEKTLDDIYTESDLQNNPQRKLINKLLIDLSS